MKKTFCIALCLFCFLTGLFPAFCQEKNYTNSIGMEFVLIPAGSFMMGCDRNFENCSDSETPQHRVSIPKPFYLGKYEVTQAEWVAVMGSNPSKFKRETNPVENVSWNDAQEFVRRLNSREGTNKYRLPTEAEWEYAARAGSTTAYSFGYDARQLGNYAWYLDNSSESSHSVGQLQPNQWGLYDMHGNAWEWVQDWYGECYYANSSGTDPKGPGSGEYRVLRGGSWFSFARICRSADRNYGRQDDRGDGNGLRLAFSPGQ